MKIAYLADSAIPSRTANSVHVMKMCQAFAALGHQVIMITPDFRDSIDPTIRDPYAYYGVAHTFEIVKIPCLFIGHKKLPDFIRLTKAIKSFKPDLVYGRFLQACFLAALYKYPTVFESHEMVWKHGVQAYVLFKLMARLRSFRGLVTISTALKELFNKKGAFPAEKMVVAHDGADDPGQVKPVLQWPGRSGALQVGYVGHLFEGRGIDILIELTRQIPDMDFHCIGGTEEDIARWRDRGKLSNMFFHGHVPPGVVPAYRARCDVLMAPYQKRVMVYGGRSETSQFMSPLKIFEYMASQRAIVCSDIPVLREVLNNQNAILVVPDNVSEWKSALNRLRDPQIRNDLATGAYDDFCARYTWNKRAQNLLSWIAVNTKR
jgi:glycosyltransferase involved in cell wall biosynthesis